MPVYALFALIVCIGGIIFKIGRYAGIRLTMSQETERPETPHKVEGRSLWQALLAVNIFSYTRFWMRANPVTFAGHVLYHTGLFFGIFTYAVVILLINKRLFSLPLDQGMMFVADWFQHKEEIFGQTGILAHLGKTLESGFIFALGIAAVGIAIPFVMSAINKRGMILPLDEVCRTAVITQTIGLKNRSWLWFERKFIGLMALVMDIVMFLSFFLPITREAAYIIHVTFGLTMLAMLPHGFLFHEIYRLRMWTAVQKVMDGRTA